MKNGTITADEILDQKFKTLVDDDESKFLHSMRPNSPQVGDQPTVVLKIGTSLTSSWRLLAFIHARISRRDDAPRSE